MVGRYGLRPLWRRRPLWLRGFATEEDELGLKDGQFPSRLSNNASGFGSSAGDGHSAIERDTEAVDSGPAVEIAVGGSAEVAVESDSDSFTESSLNSTVAAFSRRNSTVDIRPGSIDGGFATLSIPSWHLMLATLLLLSVAGIVTSLILTFAAGHGSLYLMPVVPCVSYAEFISTSVINLGSG